jgi:DNA-directed RNA polymerase specialized sigma24 family protein
VFRYLSRVVGRAETAQDLTQEVFLRVTRAEVPQADASGHRAWGVQDRAQSGAQTTCATAIVMGSRSSWLTPTERRPATQELGVAIREALAQLADVDRDVFLLRESAGLSYEEIARPAT